MLALSRAQAAKDKRIAVERARTDERRKAQKGSSIDHYAVLGVQSSATAAEIKQAYRKLALRHHPDKAPAAPPLRAAAEALFKHVAQAYAVLSDAASRRKYDASVTSVTRGGRRAYER